jgi:hypothetical protein
MRRSALPALFVCALAACPKPISAPDAGAPPVDAGAPVDAGPPPPPALAFSVQLTLPDGGGAQLPIEPGSRPLVDPPAAMGIASNLPLRNYRMRVFDDADRVVPSDDQEEDTAQRSEYRIRFSEPLKTGRRYALVVDAQSGDTFSDSSGRAHPDVRMEFQTSGERERSAKPKRHK